MKILYRSPSIKGIECRLVRLPIANREASGPRVGQKIETE